MAQVQPASDYVREAQEWKSPYEHWKASQGLPTITGLAVHGLYDNDFPLVPWKERGGSGVFVNPFVFDDRFTGEDSYFNESPMQPGGRGPWRTNYVADVMEASIRRHHVEGEGWNRAIGGFGTGFNMVNGTMRSHSSGWA